MKHSPCRFVSVTLTEAEWRALRAIVPDPAEWMKQQIREQLESAGLAHAAVEDDGPTVPAWAPAH